MDKVLKAVLDAASSDSAAWERGREAMAASWHATEEKDLSKAVWAGLDAASADPDHWSAGAAAFIAAVDEGLNALSPSSGSGSILAKAEEKGQELVQKVRQSTSSKRTDKK